MWLGCRQGGWAILGPEGTAWISELCCVGIPREKGEMWKLTASHLAQEDFLLEKEGVDSPGRCGQE